MARDNKNKEKLEPPVIPLVEPSSVLSRTPITEWQNLAMHAGPMVFWEFDDIKHQFTYVAPAKSLINFGLTPNDQFISLNKRVSLFDPSTAADVVSRIRASLDNGTPMDVEYYFKEPSGSIRWINARGNPVRNPGSKKFDRIVGVSVDITKLKLAQLELIQLEEKLEAMNSVKTELLSNISRELRIPLNSVIGFSDLLELDASLEEDQIEYLKHIKLASRSMLSMLNDLQIITALETNALSLKTERINVTERIAMFSTLLEPMAKAKEVSVNFENTEDCLVVGDSQRLDQILINLLTNAIKFNIAGGMVTCKVNQRPNNRVRVTISDTGIGVSASNLDSIFEQFSRLGEATPLTEGFGIGLALTKALVKAMDGNIEFTSELGRGSSFSVDLPKFIEPPSKKANNDSITKSSHQNSSKRNLSIVYIEDDPSHVRLVEKMAKSIFDLSFHSAKTGTAGVKLASELIPDLILLDVRLPDLTGREVMTKLRFNLTTANIPVIVISADSSEPQIRRMMSAGASAYLSKPIEVENFKNTVTFFLDSPIR